MRSQACAIVFRHPFFSHLPSPFRTIASVTGYKEIFPLLLVGEQTYFKRIKQSTTPQAK